MKGEVKKKKEKQAQSPQAQDIESAKTDC